MILEFTREMLLGGGSISNKTKMRLFMLTLAIVLLLSGCTSKSANYWALTDTQIDKLHGLGLSGKGVTIGIIDTGVEISREEFSKSNFIVWMDYVNGKTFYYDDDGHGTHIAGILFSKGSWIGTLSGHHLEGICPDAEVIVAKVVSDAGDCRDEDVADAIEAC
ncbi:MAG TPA: hypothetical protein ENG74_02600, partial [Thermoplasmatales archaeon]|nr:hypothetical protein [Thermoplasmatales archaeon]